MALIHRTGLLRFNTRYFNAARAGWRAARKVYSQQLCGNNRFTAARKVAGKAFSQYMSSHNGHSTLKPLASAMESALQNGQIEKYERELLAALDTRKHAETRNIAISGPHGAGKSAFLRAFTQRNPQHKYLHLFLPTLSETAASHETHMAESSNSAVVEAVDNARKAVVQQLLGSPPGKKPDAIIAEQPQVRGWRKVAGVFAALLTSFTIATLGYVSGYPGIDQSITVKALQQYLPDPVLALTKKYAPLLAEFSLFFITTLLALYLVSGLQKWGGGRERRIKRQEAGVSNQAAGNDLQHITRALAHSRHNVVIVENLESPRQLPVLEMLQQINRYLNSSGHIKQPVYFVYALADEAVTASERTRFFDLIIPVIPTINSTNAGSWLYEQLGAINTSGQKVTEQMDEALIEQVTDSVYGMKAINPMRVLTNIVNEFDVYLDQLSPRFANLDKNKLFAMMVIKNLYPKEHAELIHNTGVFWQALNSPVRPGHTISDALTRGSMDNPWLRELSEQRFASVLYLLKNGYFAEDYRDYLFYCYANATSEDDKRLLIGPVAEQLPVFTQQANSPDTQSSRVNPSDPRDFIELLNSPNLKTDDKVKQLKHSQQKVDNIREILDHSLSLSAQLLENNLVTASWSNVQQLFKLNKKRSLNPLLVNFIAIPENTEKLASQTLPDNPHSHNLLIALIHTRELSDRTLNQLLSAFTVISIEHLNPQSITSTRLEVIRQHPNLQFSFSTLDWLAHNENHFNSEHAYRYLLRFWHEYKAQAESTAHLTVNTIVKLLSSTDIAVNEQLWLCNLLNNENEIDCRILTVMLSLITSQPVESFTLEIRCHRLETLIDSASTLSDKIRLLSQQVKHLSRSEVLTLLSRLDIEGSGQLMQESNAFSLSNTRENLELITALRRANHIVAISDDQQKRTTVYIKTYPMTSM